MESKRLFLFILIMLFCFTGCKKKDDDDNISEAEQARIDEYIASHPEYQFEFKDSGIYYYSVTDGTGANPVKDDEVKVRYSVYYLNGTLLDTNDEIGANGYYSKPVLRFCIDDNYVIPGFNEAVKLMKEGGHCMAIVPSNRGYKDQGPLRFSIKLVDIVE
ncbi:MAG: FKBP-type peptidyl-prolyl cis-trans isomerase [Bacteroidales bacterium]|nr:FKBP-type peptidyl-prolyl cis-trans isomerase [Bacteroidales bacterium]